MMSHHADLPSFLFLPQMCHIQIGSIEFEHLPRALGLYILCATVSSSGHTSKLVGLPPQECPLNGASMLIWEHLGARRVGGSGRVEDDLRLLPL